MKTRLAFIAGAGVGFVLGARSGRQSYETIKTQATNLWNDPKVQSGIKTAEETIKEKAPVVAEKTKETASAGVDKTKAKATEVKENREEAKSEKKTEKLAEKAPKDTVSDPMTAIEDEGPTNA